MQDNAPSYCSYKIRTNLYLQQIPYIKFPPYSPDLNLIEHVWNWMKNWIQDYYQQARYNVVKVLLSQLKEIILEAQEAVLEDYIQGLYNSWWDRCQAVIDANSGPTKYQVAENLQIRKRLVVRCALVRWRRNCLHPHINQGGDSSRNLQVLIIGAGLYQQKSSRANYKQDSTSRNLHVLIIGAGLYQQSLKKLQFSIIVCYFAIIQLLICRDYCIIKAILYQQVICN